MDCVLLSHAQKWEAEASITLHLAQPLLVYQVGNESQSWTQHSRQPYEQFIQSGSVETQRHSASWNQFQHQILAQREGGRQRPNKDVLTRLRMVAAQRPKECFIPVKKMFCNFMCFTSISHLPIELRRSAYIKKDESKAPKMSDQPMNYSSYTDII